MRTNLAGAIAAASTAILLPGGVAVEPTPKVWDGTDDLDSVRAALSGSVIRMQASGVVSYGAVLPSSTVIDGRSAKLHMTLTGAAADVQHYKKSDLVTMGIDAVMPGVLSKPGAAVGAGAGGVMVGDLPAKLCLDPAAQTPLTFLNLTVLGVGGSQQALIVNLEMITGRTWRPWEASPGAPPPLVAETGVVTRAAAITTTVPRRYRRWRRRRGGDPLGAACSHAGGSG